MKVIIAGRDDLCVKQMEDFQRNGMEVLRCGLGEWDKLIELSHQGAEIIIFYGGPFPGEVINRLSDSVRCLVDMFTGYEQVDLAAATARNIMVCNSPRYGEEEVAASAISMMLSISRKLSIQDKWMRNGRWGVESRVYDYNAPYPSMRLSCMTLGVMGFGRIARQSARMGVGLGMQVIACDPYQPKEAFEAMGVQKVEPDELYARADAITIHVPMTKENYHMINEKAIAKMKDGVLIVNTARGQLIDESALIPALRSGKVAAAGLDVFEVEPLPLDHPFLSMDNVLITPHSAWHTTESYEDVDRLAAEIAILAGKGGIPDTCINRRELGLDG